MKKLADLVRKKLSKLGKYKFYILGCSVILVVGGALFFYDMQKQPKEEVKAYVYESEMETYLAENVGKYLGQHILLKDEEKGEVADIAVKTYDTILSSGVEEVTEEHTAAIEKRITDALKNVITDEQITDEDIDLLASGISQLIWDSVKTQLDESIFEKEGQYKEEKERLSRSLQSQIDSLEQKMDNLKISANIKIDSPEKVIEESKTEIYESVEQQMYSMGENIADNVDQEMEQAKDEIISEMQNRYGNITSGRDGEDGKDGVDGKDGKNGVDGKNGKDGIDGKTSYIAYADDETGNGFSLIPTETSRYIGTCISSSPTAPTEATEYKNWQPYRNYVMTTTTDENGVTTLHIN